MTVKISQKYNNVYYIIKNYTFKTFKNYVIKNYTIYDDENKCINYMLSVPMQMEGITPPLPHPHLLLLLLMAKGEGKLPPPSCFYL